MNVKQMAEEAATKIFEGWLGPKTLYLPHAIKVIAETIEKASDIAYGKGILKGWEQSRAAHASGVKRCPDCGMDSSVGHHRNCKYAAPIIEFHGDQF